MTDRILVKCVAGLCSVRVVDLSGNCQVTHSGWRALADHLLQADKHRLSQLIYQNCRHAIDDQIGEQFARMFSSLNKLDLKRCVLTDEAAKRFVKVSDGQS